MPSSDLKLMMDKFLWNYCFETVVLKEAIFYSRQVFLKFGSLKHISRIYNMKAVK